MDEYVLGQAWVELRNATELPSEELAERVLALCLSHDRQQLIKGFCKVLPAIKDEGMCHFVKATEAISDPYIRHQVLIHLCSILLEDGRPIPKELRLYGAEHLRGNRVEPKVSTGKTLMRDAALVQAVSWVAETKGLNPTRNDATEAESVCDIVCVAYNQNYKPTISLDVVLRAWKHRSSYAPF